jgi:hypothetical protein
MQADSNTTRTFPEAFEPGELARAIGAAIALNRTLILPFQRCRGKLEEGAPDLKVGLRR